MAKRPSNKQPRGNLVAQRDLAEVLGITQQAVSKCIRDPRWKEAGFSRTGPWTTREVARIKLWRAEHLQEDRSSDEAGQPESPGGDVAQATRIAKLRLLVGKHDALQLEMAIRREEYVKRTEAEEKQAAKFRTIRQSLMQLPRSLRQVLADAGDATGCEEILGSSLRALCDEWAGPG